MKKATALFLALVLVFSLASCSNGGTQSSGSATPSSSQQAQSSGAESSEPAAGGYDIDKVTVFATFAVGGGVDTFGRRMSAMLNSTGLWDGIFVYENVGGASGQVGLTQICEQHGGDETYLIPTSDNVLQSGYLNNVENAYGYNDLTLVSRLYCEYRVYVTAKSTGINSMEEMAELAKERTLVAATSGNGGASHIALSGLSYESGMDMRCVPYGDDEDIVAILSGEADIGALGSNEALTYIRSGDLIPLAVAAPEPLALEEIASVPTCVSLGYDCVFGTSRGWVLPADVDQAVVDYWADLFRQLSETEEFIAYVDEAGGTIAYLDADDFLAENERQYNETREILERIGFYET